MCELGGRNESNIMYYRFVDFTNNDGQTTVEYCSLSTIDKGIPIPVSAQKVRYVGSTTASVMQAIPFTATGSGVLAKNMNHVERYIKIVNGMLQKQTNWGKNMLSVVLDQAYIQLLKEELNVDR